LIPKSTRWNRNHSAVAEYYYKWEIDIMKKPESYYDLTLMNEMLPVPVSYFTTTFTE